jgi:hypothetical protein
VLVTLAVPRLQIPHAALAAIHSFYRFAALEHPGHAHTIARVMAIPANRHERNILSYLDPPRSRRCSPRRTAAPGSAAATTRCWR